MARAISSLPVPLSPVTSTEAFRLATRWTKLVNLPDLRARADQTIAAAGRFDALMHGLQLPLEQGILACPAEHGLQFANRRRSAAVAVCAEPDQFDSGRTQAVIGHHDGRNLRRDHRGASTRSALSSEPLFEFRSRIRTSHSAASIKAQNIVHSPVANANLKLFPQGRSKKRLQRAVFRKQANPNHRYSVSFPLAPRDRRRGSNAPWRTRRTTRLAFYFEIKSLPGCFFGEICSS